MKPGPHRKRHAAETQRLLKLEFRTFVNFWMRLPCQVLRTGRRLVLRLLAWNEWQQVFLPTGGRVRPDPPPFVAIAPLMTWPAGVVRPTTRRANLMVKPVTPHSRRYAQPKRNSATPRRSHPDTASRLHGGAGHAPPMCIGPEKRNGLRLFKG